MNDNPVEELNIHSPLAGGDVRTAKLNAIGNITRIIDYEKEKSKKFKDRRKNEFTFNTTTTKAVVVLKIIACYLDF